MLHTLNKAWITILANQINSGMIDSALFVTSSVGEYIMTERLLDELCGLKNCWIFNEEDVEYAVSILLNDRKFGDILISHDTHDVMLHNFLCKHNKRIHKEVCDE